MSHKLIRVIEHGSYSPWEYWVEDHNIPNVGHIINRHETVYVVVMVQWKPVDGGVLKPTYVVQRADQLMKPDPGFM
jgi:hypothetical protein